MSREPRVLTDLLSQRFFPGLEVRGGFSGPDENPGAAMLPDVREGWESETGGADGEEEGTGAGRRVKKGVTTRAGQKTT